MIILVATMDGASYFTVDAALYLSPPDLKTWLFHVLTTTGLIMLTIIYFVYLKNSI